MNEVVYTEQKIPRYRGNPLIECLPQNLSRKEAIDKLASFPEFSEEELLLEYHDRIHCPLVLEEVFLPFANQIKLEQAIAKTIRSGYCYRNPFNPEYRIQIAKLLGEKNIIRALSHLPDVQPGGFSFLGISGMGKTRSLKRILKLYPIRIDHIYYKGEALSIQQIPFVRVDCPHNGTRTSLCLSILEAIAQVIGVDMYDLVRQSKMTIDYMLDQIARLALIHYIGVLIIDEIQCIIPKRTNKRGDKNDEAQEIANFLMTLENKLGIPVILCGTPSASRFLSQSLKIARRNTGQGDFMWDRLSFSYRENVPELNMNEDNHCISEENSGNYIAEEEYRWDTLMRLLFAYQWTEFRTEYNQELSSRFYYHSQGIIDLAVKLYRYCQEEAIESGKDLTTELIDHVSAARFNSLQNILNDIRSGDLNAMQKYDDVVATWKYGDVNRHIRKEVKQKFLEAARKEMLDETLSDFDAVVRWLEEAGIENEAANKTAEVILSNRNGESLSELKQKAYQLYRSAEEEIKRKRKARDSDNLKSKAKQKKKDEFDGYKLLQEEGQLYEEVI